MKKIVILDSKSVNPGDLSWDGLEILADVQIYENTQPSEVIARIADASYVVTNKVQMTKEVIDACPKLKYIGVLATGYNNVDLATASAKGIVVTNIPAYSTPSVVQHVFALLLEYCNQVGHHNVRVKEGAWEQSEMFCFWDMPLTELANKTLGIIGLGQIGMGVAKVANAFGMHVVGNSRTPKNMEGVDFVSLEELYKKADVISLHSPLTEQTEGMIHKDSIAKMKDGVLLINTGRGPLVNEDDVCVALDSGKMACYMADVFSTEPPIPGSKLLYHENTIITPHYAWAPKESRARLIDIAVKNIEAAIKGKPINQVNE